MAARETVGSRIRQARTETGLTREQLAPHVGVTLRTLARWENDETPNIPATKLALLARVTGKPLSYFINSEVAA